MWRGPPRRLQTVLKRQSETPRRPPRPEPVGRAPGTRRIGPKRETTFDRYPCEHHTSWKVYDQTMANRTSAAKIILLIVFACSAFAESTEEMLSALQTNHRGKGGRKNCRLRAKLRDRTVLGRFCHPPTGQPVCRQKQQDIASHWLFSAEKHPNPVDRNICGIC